MISRTVKQQLVTLRSIHTHSPKTDSTETNLWGSIAGQSVDKLSDFMTGKACGSKFKRQRWTRQERVLMRLANEYAHPRKQKYTNLLIQSSSLESQVKTQSSSRLSPPPLAGLGELSADVSVLASTGSTPASMQKRRSIPHILVFSLTCSVSAIQSSKDFKKKPNSSDVSIRSHDTAGNVAAACDKFSKDGFTMAALVSTWGSRNSSRWPHDPMM